MTRLSNEAIYILRKLYSWKRVGNKYINLHDVIRIFPKRIRNKRFLREWIKELLKEDPDLIDKLVHDLNKHFISVIDCTLCGNCCTRLRPVVSENDIDKLLKVKQATRSDFKMKYIETDQDGDMLLKSLPCAFHKDKKCTIYSSRPEECEAYPNLHKSEITERISGIIDNCPICPIVYNLIEKLKREVGFIA